MNDHILQPVSIYLGQICTSNMALILFQKKKKELNTLKLTRSTSTNIIG